MSREYVITEIRDQKSEGCRIKYTMCYIFGNINSFCDLLAEVQNVLEHCEVAVMLMPVRVTAFNTELLVRLSNFHD